MIQAVLMGQWKAIKNSPDSLIELYNISIDIGEQNNLAEQNAEIVKEMLHILKREHRNAPPQVDRTAKEAHNLYVPEIFCAE